MSKNKKGSHRQRRNKLIMVACGILMLLCIALVVAMVKLSGSTTDNNTQPVLTQTVIPEQTDSTIVETPVPTAVPTQAPTSTPEPTATPEPTPESGRTVTITAVGDCTLGGDPSTGSYQAFERVARNNGADYFLQNVRSIFEADDLTIINLEGPLTDSTTPQRAKRYCFRGHPEYVQILTGSSIEICNLANNHMYDYDTQGFEDTKATLDSAGIGYSGMGTSYFTDINGVRVCSLGFWWENTGEEMLGAIHAARPNCDLLIVSMHCGTEGSHELDDKQPVVARKLIDEGADVVIGTHPHVYQGLELYNGKYIVYSLGNFCFGGNGNPGDKDTFIFRERFTFDSENNITDTAIDVIPARLSSSNSKNDYCPMLLTDSAAKILLRKIAAASIGDISQFSWLEDSVPVQLGIVK